ncbi:hypothetical protein LTR91_022203 [Friedmanniomyces endolithicus]|uniref:BZIP domain-containing protein n=1 Tax=Friedmanniomyces endolithicus TaxID=329885 RepID=A0AAN6H8Q9_9PEZI|nr:hypothetical protein LTR57_024237 [Friedmanniomyces endolithicus]KAK0953208.1 hypothetical protein LTS01_024484 [Friedmanniomyces endolithicus]KAK0956780.1 hypothetical protein LTR91_022203 [Friedmanniomyces endolithicus]
MSTPNSKNHARPQAPAGPCQTEEQLARVRRNQQRSRARKQAHVVELETQVQDLQSRLGQCTPCPPSSASPSTGELERYQRENAARRDLLCGLGFGEETQQRYIDSAARRNAVQVALSIAGLDDEQKVHSAAQQAATQPPGIKGASVVTPESVSGINRVALNTPILPTDDTSINADFNINEWMLSLNGTGGPSFLLDREADDPSWLAMSTIPLSADSTDTDQARNTPLASYAPGLSVHPDARVRPTRALACPTAQLSPSTVTESSLDRCFLETAMNFRPGKTSTACSVAITMVLQHNRKGLSLAELNDRMKSGFVAAKDPSTECKVWNTTLSQVLADISTVEQDDSS